MRLQRHRFDRDMEHPPEDLLHDTQADAMHAIVWGAVVMVAFGCGVLCGLLSRGIWYFCARLLHAG